MGGSFSGLSCARALKREFNVTVVDFKNYFEYTPGILRVFVEPTFYEEISCPLTKATKGATFVQARATSVNDKSVTVAKPDGSTEDIAYDYLLLGTGSIYPSPIKPTEQEGNYEKRKENLDAASKKLKKAGSVLIVGGGPVGVELAGEILTEFPNKKVTIVDGLPTIVAPFPKDSIAFAHNWLLARGCKFEMNQAIAGKFPDLEIDESGCNLTDGRRLTADVVYKCLGSKANAGYMKETYPEALDRGGRLIVNEHLQLKNNPRIFGMGDCMILPGVNEWKLAHTAEINAHLVSANLLRMHRGEKLKTYPEGMTGGGPTPQVYCLSLGKYSATLGLNWFVMSGGMAAFAKWGLEYTKVMAMTEKPLGLLIWRLADWSTFLLGRTLLKPKPKEE